MIPRASHQTTVGDEMDIFLNRGSIGFQGSLEVSQPVSFGQTLQGNAKL